MHVSLEHPAGGARQDRPEQVRVQNSRHVDDDIQISELDASFYEMDGRRCRYIKEVLDWYGQEDAGDLRRKTLNESVENTTAPNALEGKIWKSEKSNQNGVINEQIMKNIVMSAKIDPKDPRSKIGGLNNLQPNNQHLLEQLMDENEPWLLMTIPHRGPFLVTQYTWNETLRVQINT